MVMKDSLQTGALSTRLADICWTHLVSLGLILLVPTGPTFFPHIAMCFSKLYCRRWAGCCPSLLSLCSTFSTACVSEGKETNMICFVKLLCGYMGTCLTGLIIWRQVGYQTSKLVKSTQSNFHFLLIVRDNFQDNMKFQCLPAFSVL